MGRMDQQHGRPPWSTTGSRPQERWLGGQERAMEQRAWNTQIHYTNLDGTQPPPFEIRMATIFYRAPEPEWHPNHLI